MTLVALYQELRESEPVRAYLAELLADFSTREIALRDMVSELGLPRLLVLDNCNEPMLSDRELTALIFHCRNTDTFLIAALILQQRNDSKAERTEYARKPSPQYAVR